MAIEVFKTNVNDGKQAGTLISRIENGFSGYAANFDLDDCDRILRVVSSGNAVDAPAIVRLLLSFGFHAEVLSDDIPELLQF